MNTTTVSAPTARAAGGLRASRARRTRDAIQASALRLAHERGYDATTVEDVAADARTILTELEAYSPVLAEKPRITVLNKIDALDDETLAERKAALEAEIGGPVMTMSGGVSRQGVTEVLRALWTALEPTRAPVAAPRTTWQP